MMKTQKGITNKIMGLYTRGRLELQHCSLYNDYILSQWNEISPISKVYR